ncbi:MAG: glycine oxidase ThiO [Thioalkalispiraceae bacterium]
MNKFDAIIVGGGLIGMLSARELSQAGLSVALVERNTTGRESSWAGGGILSPLYPWRYADAVTALARHSQKVYAELVAALQQETGIDPQLQHSGLLILDTEEQQQAQTWAEQWQVTLQYLETREQLQAIEAGLAKDYEDGLWFPEVGQVRNPRLAQSLRVSIEKQGVTLFEHCPVEHLLVAQGRVKGVQTSEGRLEAAKVVIAGGAWSATLLAETGVVLPVKPIRGQMLLFRAEPGIVSRIVLSRDRYVIPRRDGRVLVGSTLEDVGFEKQTTGQARDELYAEALRIIPGLEAYPVEHHWAGLRPASPEGIPYICSHPHIEGVFINTGHYRNGVVLGPASCHLLRQLVLGESPELDPTPYAISLN